MHWGAGAEAGLAHTPAPQVNLADEQCLALTPPEPNCVSVAPCSGINGRRHSHHTIADTPTAVTGHHVTPPELVFAKLPAGATLPCAAGRGPVHLSHTRVQQLYKSCSMGLAFAWPNSVLPPVHGADIAGRFVLLLDPVLGTGNTACKAIQVRGWWGAS